MDSNDQRDSVLKEKHIHFFFEKIYITLFLLNEKSFNCTHKILPIKLFKK